MLTKLIKVQKLLRNPSQVYIVSKNAYNSPFSVLPDLEHLKASMSWLSTAQDNSGSAGFSAAYNLVRGWEPPYPETTGYIIPNLIEWAKVSGDNSSLDRAFKATDWEVEVQFPDGGVRAGYGLRNEYAVFNTGQVILGLLAAYRENENKKFLDAAVKAADWLLGVQDDDGKWTKFAYHEIPHVYYTRVSWPVLEVYEATGEEKYLEAGKKHIEWTLDQLKDGWTPLMSFDYNKPPFTHTVAYTLRGLLEASKLLKNSTGTDAYKKALELSRIIADKYEKLGFVSNQKNKYMPARLGKNWESTDRSTCLTGNAQLAIVFYKLYEKEADPLFLTTANNLVDDVKRSQAVKSVNECLRGAVPGSWPVWGNYLTYSYPNWAANFFAEALMLKIKIMRKE